MTITRDEFRALEAKAMTEKELQAAGDRIAHDLGYLCYHTWRSIHSSAGYPDSTYLRGWRGIVVEYKREGRDATIAQHEWLTAFTRTGFQAYLWHPSDLLSGRIAETLA